MELRIDHIGIAVKDLESVVREFKKIFDQQEPEYYEVDSLEVKVAVFKAGEIGLEFLAGTTPESPITRHIEKRGQGVQHIALKVENIEKVAEELISRGAEFLDDKPTPGAGGKRVLFLHPSAFGMLIELCEEEKK